MANITVYTTPTWPHCTTLKRFLSEKGIQFEEVDLSKDQAAQLKVLQAVKQLVVPVSEINGEWVVGFDAERIEELL